MLTEAIYYQPTNHLDPSWTKTALLFTDKIKIARPKLVKNVVYDRAISRFKLLSSEKVGVYNRELLTANNASAKQLFYDCIGGLSKVITLREGDGFREKSDFEKELFDAGMADDYSLTNQSTPLNSFLEHIKSNLHLQKNVEFLSGKDVNKTDLLLSAALRESLDDLIQLFPSALPDEIFIPIDYNADGHSKNYWKADKWVKLDKAFLDYFYNSIVVLLSSTERMPVLTDRVSNYDLTNQIKLPSKSSAEQIAKGSLFHILVENFQIPGDTPFSKIKDFKNRFVEEIHNFKVAVNKLAKMLEAEGHSADAIRKQTQEIYKDNIERSVHNLKKSLHLQGIRFSNTSLMRIALTSTFSIEIVKGLNQLNVFPNNTALSFFVTAGLIVAQSVFEYNIANKEKLVGHDYAYLIEIERKFSLVDGNR